MVNLFEKEIFYIYFLFNISFLLYKNVFDYKIISYYYKKLNKTFSFLASFNIFVLYNKEKGAFTLSTFFFLHF